MLLILPLVARRLHGAWRTQIDFPRIAPEFLGIEAKECGKRTWTVGCHDPRHLSHFSNSSEFEIKDLVPLHPLHDALCLAWCADWIQASNLWQIHIHIHKPSIINPNGWPGHLHKILPHSHDFLSNGPSNQHPAAWFSATLPGLPFASILWHINARVQIRHHWGC